LHFILELAHKRIYASQGVQLIRSQNVRPDGIDINNSPVYLDPSVLSGDEVFPCIGDILVVRSGVNAGDTATVEVELLNTVIGADTVLIRLEDNIEPKYIQSFFSLPIGKLIMQRTVTGATNKHISPYNLGKINIPVPDLNIQRIIISKLDDAYALKKQKELEAQRSLDSIDDYLLGELGINLPEAEENTVQNRIFYRNFNDISGNRFDCNYNSKINLILSQNGKYKITYLKNLLVNSPQYGANEIAIDKNSATEVTYIRITDIDDFGYLKKDSLKTASTIEEQYILKKNDLLFARSGSVGRCYLHQDDTHKSIFAGYLIRFVINTEIANPYYVFYYCHSKIYKMWVDAIYRSAVQSNINSEEYKSLPIFLPPLDKQLEIVEHIDAIRDQAKQLQQEAEAELEKAKQEVEAMILGVE
jgi:type I restriction enzyme M protein